MKTISANAESAVNDWYVIDATDKILGRLATFVANRLRGKHKAEYTPHVDTGDYIVIVNADKIKVTGNKSKDKLYHHYSGYQGGMKSTPLEVMMSKYPQRVIQLAVKGMMPKNRLSRDMMRKLKIYAGSAHPHSPQQPKQLNY